VVVLYLSVVSHGQAIGVLATKGIPLRIAADREKGRAGWHEAGLPAQSLRCHRFRRGLRAFRKEMLFIGIQMEDQVM